MSTLSARRVVVDNLIEEIAGGGSLKERSASMRLQLPLQTGFEPTRVSSLAAPQQGVIQRNTGFDGFSAFHSRF